MVELKDISHSYKPKFLKNKFSKNKFEETAALKQVNARFEEGRFSAIIGSSGCGKTSLIKIMAALVTPSEGTVSVRGSPLTEVREKTAVIFQDYGLLPWKTVIANAELPLRINGNRSGYRRDMQKVEALLAEFGLTPFTNNYPQELSGGMKQRLAIVRALVREPELLLMDEPFSSLDALTREAAQNFFISMQRKRRLTVIMVTHSIEEAVYLADYVYIMNGVNPGTISGRIAISRDEHSSHNGGLSHADFRNEPRFLEYCGSLRSALIPMDKNGEAS